MKKYLYMFRLFIFIGAIYLLKTDLHAQYNHDNTKKIDLSGQWNFQIDSLDQGITQQWFSKELNDKIQLPGSMTTNGKGNDITINTPWTGSIVDSSWFFKPQYAKYQQPGNIKVPFWLQPIKYYKGAAWYQKRITIPSSWKGKHIELFLERSHWETTIWVDDKKIGMQNSLGAPHVFDLTNSLNAGTHKITVRIDNRIKDINVGQNSHSITDHTQTNWNGMIGKLLITARPDIYLDDVQLYPDIKNKKVVARITVNSITNTTGKISVRVQVTSSNPAGKLQPLTKEFEIKEKSNEFEIVYRMGDHPLLWNEFHPNLYSLEVEVASNGEKDTKKITFGMREFSTRGTQFTINGQLTFLRGTLECAIFPKTGYPPTDVASWMHIFKVCRSYGLNHIRFHSWTPPEAAFEAADRSGFYLHVECSSWANQGATIGDGKPLDQYIYDESNRVVKAYGNHPSFCMLAYEMSPPVRTLPGILPVLLTIGKRKIPGGFILQAADGLLLRKVIITVARIQEYSDGEKA